MTSSTHPLPIQPNAKTIDANAEQADDREEEK